MITGPLRSQIDRLWTEFWTGGITNPLTVIEQISFLMFARLLDIAETRAEKRSARTGKFHLGQFGKHEQHLRWSHLKNLPAEEMLKVVRDGVFPHFRGLSGEGSTFSEYMKDAQLMIVKPSLLVSAVNMIDALPLTEGDTKGDLYEYLLSKLTTAGINGQFRTPRHIIRLMVDLVEPKPTEVIGDPACGTAGFLVGVMQHLLEKYTSPEGVIVHDDGQKTYSGDLLEPYRKQIQSGMFHGYDFDATMLRIAAMNLMLHGVESPDIHYQDTLSNSFPERFPAQADRRLRRDPRQPALQGEPRRVGRPSVPDRQGEDEEDGIALRLPAPADAQAWRPGRVHRAGRRPLRLVERSCGTPQAPHRGEPARGCNLDASWRLQALRRGCNSVPGLCQGR